MIKASHVVRFEYDETYRRLRLYGGVLDRENEIRAENWIEECALLSYDNRDHYFFGWANVQRWRIWKDKIYNRWPEKELPF